MCAVATLVSLSAPAAFGMAMGPMLDRLGTLHEHVCKCGMKRGTCGCPACERAEHERLRARSQGHAPALKGDCERGAPAILFAALPAATPPATTAVVPAAPRVARMARGASATTPRDRDLDPPVPPPRLARS